MSRNWPIVLLTSILAFIVAISCYSSSNTAIRHATDGNTIVATANPHGSDGQSEVVDGWRRLLIWPEGVTALAIVLTLVFIAWQAMLTRQAIHLAENSAKKELRAYLAVAINAGSYQERNKEIRFAGTPALTNTGKTPAHNVRYRANAAILKEPLSPNYTFPPGQEEIGQYAVGMNQSFQITTVVDDYIDSQDVESVMIGTSGRALYHWGIVHYDDAFGEHHVTEFCHRLYFYRDGEIWRVNGTYVPGKNGST